MHVIIYLIILLYLYLLILDVYRMSFPPPCNTTTATTTACLHPLILDPSSLSLSLLVHSPEGLHSPEGAQSPEGVGGPQRLCDLDLKANRTTVCGLRLGERERRRVKINEWEAQEIKGGRLKEEDVLPTLEGTVVVRRREGGEEVGREGGSEEEEGKEEEGGSAEEEGEREGGEVEGGAGKLDPANKQVESDVLPPSGWYMVPFWRFRLDEVVIRYVSEVRPSGSAWSGGYKEVDGAFYYTPLLYVDDIAVRKGGRVEIGEDGEGRGPVKFRMTFRTCSYLRHNLFKQLKFGLETLIMLLHLFLSTMAFKSEIGFYVGRTDMKGVSPSGLVVSFASSVIIWLYLMDGEGTSKVVIWTVGMEVMVDAWKLKKMLRPRLKASFPWVGVPGTRSPGEDETSTYDWTATSHVTMALLPALVGGGIYSLREYRYRGWYSFLVSHAANCVYMVGFVRMCPQVYVNYRLKSTSHLPTNMFVYKIFNTFVDDVFAVLIDMPLKHRVMTLRDDVIFAVILWQKWAYKVDYKRVNDFGYAFDKEGEEGEGEEKEEGVKRIMKEEGKMD
ncbi:hypothetical protein TrRE_jg481 [Triparma retinervis]|uniref:Uncharacterized protein n=1 Tax=Triparma retinervis TaxID=2557542 RepID=A0A9W6ZJQ4_9STRA|nr:hypothetical protein TrRE_jg481 [Triparma retinervis]